MIANTVTSVTWTPINLFLEWVAQNNPLRKVTAAPGNFNWSNPAAWIDSVPGVQSAAPNNTRGSIESTPTGRALLRRDPEQSGHDHARHEPQIDTCRLPGRSPARHRRPTRLRSAGHHAVRRHPDDGWRHARYVRVLMSGGLLTGGGTIAGSPNFQGPCGNKCASRHRRHGGAGRHAEHRATTRRLAACCSSSWRPAAPAARSRLPTPPPWAAPLGVGVTPGLYGLSTPYTLLTAGAISGQFAQFIPPRLPHFFRSLGPSTVLPPSM